MQSSEFMYWLQGCFELSGLSNLNVEQVQTIKRHFEMVKVVDGKNMLPFCHYFEGFMNAVDWQLSNQNVEKLKEKLNSCFEHVVPQTIEVRSERRSGVHLDPNQSELIKC